MKNRGKLLAVIAAAVIAAAETPMPAAFAAAADNGREAAVTTYKNGAVVPSAKAPSMRKAAQEKALAGYYITDGEKLDKAVAVLKNLKPEATGLAPDTVYSYRMDKALTGDYFYHVRALQRSTGAAAGDYLVARDDSCVFRRFSGEARTELLNGSTEKLLEKVEIYPAYKKIPADGVGKVLIRVPGNIPYNLTLTSLNENILKINTDKKGQQWTYGVTRGKADVLAEVEICGYVKSKQLTFTVMDEKDVKREENRSSGIGFPIGIGIGFGWGRGHHHHHGHGGGIVIGM